MVDTDNSTRNSIILVAVVGLIFVGIGITVPDPAPETYETHTYELKINSNTVDTVSDTAVVHTYGSLTEKQKDIFMETLGTEKASKSSEPPTYVYTDEKDRPAEKLATADYIQKDNQYYQVISQTSITSHTSDVNSFGIMASMIGLLIWVVGSIKIAGDMLGEN